jgi:benzoate/toluate 1,2-dioxygenase reductase component
VGHRRIPVAQHLVVVKKIRRFSDMAFELLLTKPPGFFFTAGQRVTCIIEGESREYTLACSPSDSHLALCVRHVTGGYVSSRMLELKPGDALGISGPHGYFIHRPGTSVFVATGTGIAPFVAFCRSGVRGNYLLHGISGLTELYYREVLERRVDHYIPCCSAENKKERRIGEGYFGRVTEYLQMRLPEGQYNFYLCGNGQMIRDAMAIIDKRFPDAKVFNEMFFSK